MHSFHVILEDGTEEDHKAANHRVVDGALVLVTEGATDDKDPAGIIFAPGTWRRSELERRDDKG